MIALRKTVCAFGAFLLFATAGLAATEPRELEQQPNAPMPEPSAVLDTKPSNDKDKPLSSKEIADIVRKARGSAPKKIATRTTRSTTGVEQAPPSEAVPPAPSAQYGSYYAPEEEVIPGGVIVPDCGCQKPCGCTPGCGAAPVCGCEKPCGCGKTCGCQPGPDCGCSAGGCSVGGCSNGGCRGRCERCPLDCVDCDPWRLFPESAGPCGRISAGGWLAVGGSLADGNPPSHYNGPVTFNDRLDFQGNQAYTFLERKIANDGCGFDIGGRIDTLYGTDHRFTMARGLETTRAFGPKWNAGGSNLYGVALPQAYVEVAYNDVSFKLGHYYTIIGYESVMSPANFFYSHTYTMQYGEPFTHTGALGSYQATDKLTLYGGVDRGWDNWEDDNANESVLWGVTWDGGCGSTLTVTGTWGKEMSTIGAPRNGDRTLVSIVATQEINSRLAFAIQSDIGRQDNAGTGATQAAEWYGIAQYLTYKINCQWTAGMRFEWFRDDDGARVTGLGAGNPIAGSQFAGNFYEVTLGLNYKRSPNLTIRPELRYDEYTGQASPTAGALPFGDGTDSKQLSGAIDLILTF